MSVDFRLARLSIDGFRGIRELDLPLEEDRPTYLIGGNNTGKSTILNAFALGFRGGGFHTFKPAEYDFFHDGTDAAADRFTITIDFEAAKPEQLPGVQGVGPPVLVHGLQVLGRRVKGGFQHRHVLLDDAGEAIVISPRTPLKAKDKETFKDHGLGWKQVYAKLDDIRASLPEVWLLRPDNLERSLYIWKTGPLHRLASLLSERFLETEWSFDFKDQKRQMPKSLHTVYEFYRAAVEQFPFWRDDLKPRLEASLGTYLGRSAGVGLTPSVQAIEDWLAQQLVVSFCAEAGGPLTPLRCMGDGWQTLVRLAALEALQHYEPKKQHPVLLLYEEPETYLHPHLRRKLRDVVETLAKAGWVCVSSTHAPEFVSFSRAQQVVRLWRTGAQTEHGRIICDAIPEGPKFQEKLNERGTDEFLFANKVVLCEGKDDVFGIRMFLEKSSVDMDGKGVTVVDAGGRGNLPAYAKIASDLHIPWFAITDQDLQDDGTDHPKSVTVRAALTACQSDRDSQELWTSDLESCLKVPAGKATPDWQETELAPKTLTNIKTTYPDFHRVCEAVSTWIG